MRHLRIVAAWMLTWIAGCELSPGDVLDEPPDAPSHRPSSLRLEHRSLSASFDDNGATLRGAGPNATGVLVATPRVARRQNAPSARLRDWRWSGQRIQSDIGDGVTEWWETVPRGLEQSFAVTVRLPGQGPLTVTIPIEGARPQDGPRAGLVHLVDERGAVLHSVSKVVAHDATGARVPATLGAAGQELVITVEDGAAMYPLVIDPLYAQHAKLVASTPDFAAFGYQVALSGDTLLVSAPYEGQPAANEGAVYVFREEDEVWSLEQKLLPPAPKNAELGAALAIDGDTAAISHSGYPYEVSGSVYVFERSGGSWSLSQELVSPVPFPGEAFGSDLAIDGDRIVVGAPAPEVPGAPGAAYVFTQIGSTWSMQQKLIPSTLENVAFGYGVAIQGDEIAVTSGGTIVTYTEVGGIWSAATVLTPPPGQSSLGSVVAMHQDTLLASGQHPVVFTRTASTWSLQGTLTVNPPDVQHAARVGLANDQAAVICGPPGFSSLKSVCLFRRSGTTWNQTEKFAPAGGAVPGFGSSLAVGPTRVAVGQFTNQSNADEAVYIFDSLAAKGEICTVDADCMSSHCAGGLCCDAACDSVCVACDQLGSVGTCTALPLGRDPNDDCPGGTCDGAGGCSYAAGEPCTRAESCPSGFCVDGFCCDQACDGECGTCGRAGRHGVCSPLPEGAAGVRTCAPYVCDGENTECPTTCSEGSDCAPGHVCQAGACLAGLEPASPCTGPELCITGYCADGVCCDQPCGGSAPDDCQACSIAAGGISDGACTQVLFTAGLVCRASAGPCDPAEACDGASPACPVDAYAADGAACDDVGSETLGVCAAGTCTQLPTEPNQPDPGGSSVAADDGGCSCAVLGRGGRERAAPNGGLGALLGAAGAFFYLARRRRPWLRARARNVAAFSGEPTTS